MRKRGGVCASCQIITINIITQSIQRSVQSTVRKCDTSLMFLLTYSASLMLPATNMWLHTSSPTTTFESRASHLCNKIIFFFKMLPCDRRYINCTAVTIAIYFLHRGKVMVFGSFNLCAHAGFEPLILNINLALNAVLKYCFEHSCVCLVIKSCNF